MAARETAQALKILAQSARGVAASTTDPQSAVAMLDSARDVMEGSALLIHEAKQALVAPGDAESQQRLAQVRWRTAPALSRPRWLTPAPVQELLGATSREQAQGSAASLHPIVSVSSCISSV